MQETSFDKENTVSNKTYSQIFSEIREQVYKNTGVYPSNAYVSQWMVEHNLWKHPETVKSTDIDKLYIIEQHLEEGIIFYNNEKVENICLVTAMGDGATIEDLLEAHEYQPISEKELEGFYISLYTDNPEKYWTDIEPSELDKFIEQIDNAKKIEG